MDNSVTAAGAEFAGLVVLLGRRYAANVPASQRGDVDQAVWATLGRVPGAREVAERLVRRADRLPKDRKRRLFGSTYAFEPVGTRVTARDVEGIIDRLGGRTPPSRTPSRPHRYDLQFSHMIARDESNPERFGKDEPYTVFTVITQEQMEAGEPARSVRTPTYKVNEGERAPASGSERLRLFGPAGPAVLDSDLLVTAAHFEHDLGDIAGIVAELTALVTIVAALASSAKKDLVQVVLAAIGVISGFLVSIAADDPVGEPQALLLSPQDAEDGTQNTAQVTLPALRFNGGDPNGVYEVFLTLRRS